MTTFESMIGRTMEDVRGKLYDEQMIFVADDGSVFRFFHERDCCERVSIEDICGDLRDLVGAPLLVAEKVTNEPDPGFADNEIIPESYTWTFYRFATIKGTVTVRWLGTSNGYYSESVDYVEDIVKNQFAC